MLVLQYCGCALLKSVLTATLISTATMKGHPLSQHGHNRNHSLCLFVWLLAGDVVSSCIQAAPKPADAAGLVSEALAAVEGWSWGIQQAVRNTDSITRSSLRDRYV